MVHLRHILSILPSTGAQVNKFHEKNSVRVISGGPRTMAAPSHVKPEEIKYSLRSILLVGVTQTDVSNT
jgi:hypothetical protein